MKKGLLNKSIAILLIFAMLLEVGTPLCYAAGLDDEIAADDQVAQESLNGSEAVFDAETAALLNSTNEKNGPLKASDDTVVGESVYRRDEHAKGYRLKDGSDAVFLYPFAVNEKGSDGCWVEIDNTLVKEQNKDGEQIYTAGSISKEASFYAEPEPGRILELATANGSISWGLMGIASGVLAGIKEPEIEEGYSVLQPKSVGSILKYEDVLPGIDLRLQLVGNDAEENVILNSPSAAEIAAAGLSYRLNLTGYSAELTDEGILLIPEGSEEAEYEITASYMEDAEGSYSKAIDLELEQDTEGYIVTVHPSFEWLLSSERVYPIVIDPTIAMRTTRDILISTTVVSVSGYDPQHICGTHHVGKTAAYYGKMRSAMQFDLPTQVTEADMVIDAGIIAKQRGYSGPDGGTVTVNAHRITTTAAINGNFKWATLDGHYEALILDSQTLSYATRNKWVTWDITKAVKDWYLNGGNNGIALISENEETVYKYIGYISPYDTGVSSSNYPVISVTYLNQEGLESYQSYHSAGSGSMGTLSVGDFNGNLVYSFGDLSLSGEYLPLSIQHVYNHSQRTNADVVSSDMHYGAGFRLNLSQKITAITDSTLQSSGYWYTLTDEDGTVHYFRLKSGTGSANGSTYEKEFETTTILSKSSSGFTLDYNSDLVYTFNTSGLLTKIQDNSNGKSMTLSYSSSRLTGVTDGAGRMASLTYDSGGYLTKITDPAGRETTYTYSSGRLIRITSPDGKYVQFTYSAGGDGTQMMTAVTDIDSGKIEIAYYTNAPCRVKSLLEKGTSSGEGGKLTWTYGTGETTITDRNGRAETIMFDNAGHTVCTKDSAGNAYFGTYNNTDDNKMHALKLSSDLQGTVTNYLVNHGFESTSTSPWTLAPDNTGSGTFSIDTTQHSLGSKSMKITSSDSGGTYMIAQNVTIPGCRGTEVTVSAMLKLSGLSMASGVNRAGVWMTCMYMDSGGNWVESGVGRLSGNCDWKYGSKSVSIPADAASETISVRIGFYRASGTLYVDCMQTEAGSVPNRYNILENGYFSESSGAGSAAYWTGTNLTAGIDQVAAGRSGSGFKITGEADKAKYIKQTVNVSGSAGDSFVFSAWGKADAIKTNNTSAHLSSAQTRPFGVTVRFVKPDNTYEDVTASFDAKSSGWQYLSGTAVAPVSYSKIEYLMVYSYQKNAAVFDDAQLFKEGFGDVITYDSFGRTTSVTDSMGRTTTYAYLADSRPEISSITYPDGSQTIYTYDASTHKLLTVKDADNKTATYSYDSNWNNTKVSMTSGGTTLSSGVRTFGTAGYVTKSADSLGNETNYTYNTNKGLLTKVTEANGAVTNYTYNANNDLLTKIDNGSSNVQYAYTNRRLTGLSHTAGSAVSYSLAYDQFGARTAVNVGTQNLASYTYAANNGNLTRTTYGNGDYTEPVYDSYDRQIGLKVNGTLKLKWHYGTDGRVGYEEDLANGVRWRYYYNKSGELTTAIGTNGDTISIAYDSSGKTTSRTLKSGSAEAVSSYTYNSSNKFLTGITYKAGSTQIGQLSLSYDGFERVSRTLATSGSASLSAAYAYMVGTRSNTTTLIPSSMTTSGPGWSSQYSYTYDSMGNIATVSHGGNTTRYLYDSLNQLTREDNQAAGKTWVYSYDAGGNITSAKEYNYTTGTFGTVLSTKTYTYGDSNWKDKLTSYEGTTISYDSIGNPLSYRGMTFTWQAGRQLASVTSGGTATTYAYNSSGIRISKTVGGTTTKYSLVGTQVAKATTGSDYVLYYYDENGSPVMFRSCTGGTSLDYYYVKDLQGDVVAITNAAGSKVVEYTYDAWGKILSTTGTLANTIGQSNPYRYRGYWFDTETGLYYLQSRYYDPQTGRFINADIMVSTGQGVLGSNMLAYCLNNPIRGIDSEGTFVLSMLVAAMIGGAIGGALVSALSCVVESVISGESLSFSKVVGRVVLGAAEGAIGGVIGSAVQGAKIVFSVAVGVVEGVRAYNETDGTVKEKREQGFVAFGTTSIVTYAGSMVMPGLGSTCADILMNTASTTTKYGLTGLFISTPAAALIDNRANQTDHNNANTTLAKRLAFRKYWRIQFAID